MFTKTHANVLSAIILWAYEHDIEVRFYRQRDFNDDGYPVIRFSRNDRHIVESFATFTEDNVRDFASHVWQHIGFKLCVEKPEFL